MNNNQNHNNYRDLISGVSWTIYGSSCSHKLLLGAENGQIAVKLGRRSERVLGEV